MADEIRIKKASLRLIATVLVAVTLGVVGTWLARWLSEPGPLDIAFTAAAVSACFVAWGRR
jgi:hypothetical protein